MDRSNDPLWPRPPQSFFRIFQSYPFFLTLNVVVALALHSLALLRFPTTSHFPAPLATDLLNDGSVYYGKPLVTVGTIPFGVKNEYILNQFLVSIGSWLRASAQIIVHIYDVIDGMGPFSSQLVELLQNEFGTERIMVRGKILRKLHIETIAEAFEIIESHTETVFAGWFSTDMILAPDWMNYVFACMQYFGEYKNYSMHFVRRDLYVSCRKDINLEKIVSLEWPVWFSAFKRRCNSRLHNLGYDCYLWNYRGINMTAAHLAPFFIGRPDFDGAIISTQMKLGWFVSTFTATETFHLEHPDRPQYTKIKNHPDSIHNRKLMMANGGLEFPNSVLNLRLSLSGISERKNGTWSHWSLERPKGAFPLGYPPLKTSPDR
jgi:hypothetical protein